MVLVTDKTKIWHRKIVKYFLNYPEFEYPILKWTNHSVIFYIHFNTHSPGFILWLWNWNVIDFKTEWKRETCYVEKWNENVCDMVRNMPKKKNETISNQLYFEKLDFFFPSKKSKLYKSCKCLKMLFDDILNFFSSFIFDNLCIQSAGILNYPN